MPNSVLSAGTIADIDFAAEVYFVSQPIAKPHVGSSFVHPKLMVIKIMNGFFKSQAALKS